MYIQICYGMQIEQDDSDGADMNINPWLLLQRFNIIADCWHSEIEFLCLLITYVKLQVKDLIWNIMFCTHPHPPLLLLLYI